MNQVISVSQFVEIINETLGFAYPAVTVEGEISAFKILGHNVYFDLKDDQATLGCYIFKPNLQIELADGMKIRATGSPKLLARRGNFSLTVRTVELAGEGELLRAYELLKGRLEKEGLFSLNRKRLLPVFPSRIGLITSADSAAFSDFMKILSSRWGGVKVELVPVQVQGPAAPDQILTAIDYFNQLAQPVDLLAIIRGGGSLEDLQAFNTEMVTRAIAGSRTPTIVGVGHERDVSLADLAADVRAATPTDAARLAVPDRHQIASQLTAVAAAAERGVRRSISERQQRLDRQMRGLEIFMRLPRERAQSAEAKLWRFADRFENSLASSNLVVLRSRQSLIKSWQHRLAKETARLNYQVNLLQRLLWRPKLRLDRLESALRANLNSYRTALAGRLNQIESLERLIKNSNPRTVLAKGYSISTRGGRIIKTASSVPIGSRVMIELHQGKLDTTVNDTTT